MDHNDSVNELKFKYNNRDNKKIDTNIQDITPNKGIANNFSDDMPKLFSMQQYSSVNKNFLFSNFVVGETNNRAYYAAHSIAESIVEDKIFFHNLYISGGIGVGKTHLAQAIVNHVNNSFPNQALYMSSETFMREFTKYSANDKVEYFRNFFKSLKLLIIDDLQLMQGRWTKTQVELVNTINIARSNNFNTVTVFVANKHVNDLDDFNAFLRDRIGSGVSVNIESSDYHLRLKFIEERINAYNKHAKKNVHIDNAVIRHIADKENVSMRELESSINSIIIYTLSTGGSPVSSRAYDIIARNSSVRRKVNMSKIIEIVADYYNVDADIITANKNRKKFITNIRNIAIYLCRVMTDISLEGIGKKFNRTHSAVIRSYKIIKTAVDEAKENNSQSDMNILFEIDTIKSRINNSV